MAINIIQNSAAQLIVGLKYDNRWLFVCSMEKQMCDCEDFT